MSDLRRLTFTLLADADSVDLQAVAESLIACVAAYKNERHGTVLLVLEDKWESVRVEVVV